jgi:hypothetical protein
MSETRKMHSMVFFLSFVLALMGNRVLAQEISSSLSPSEAYKAALSPLNEARAQQDNLTDADKFALGVGMARASHDCLALSAHTSALETDAKELLSLGELCLVGQQYEQARVTLTKYLVPPQPQEKKLALILLARAHLGLKEPGSAAAEVNWLLRDYPYDAQIHFAIDQVIDASEEVDAKFNDLALHLCATQNAVTLPLLVNGKAIEGKDLNGPSNVLFTDAIHCAALAEVAGKSSSAQDTMHQLTAIAKQQNWTGTADLAPIQAALARQMMVGAQVPLDSLHGHALSDNALVPRTVSLTRGTVLLLPFTLWSPSAPGVARDLAKFALPHTIYAIASWAANTGREDAPSNESLAALRSWQRTLPPHVSILIVPEAELAAFHADSFPAGIMIRNGIVHSNSVLSTQGSERVLLSVMADRIEKP